MIKRKMRKTQTMVHEFEALHIKLESVTRTSFKVGVDLGSREGR
jgi:Ethanolamine utilization protein EutJ (predicted chaperonin)